MSQPIYKSSSGSGGCGTGGVSPVKILNDAITTSRAALVNYKNNVDSTNIGAQKAILLTVLQTQAAITYFYARDL